MLYLDAKSAWFNMDGMNKLHFVSVHIVRDLYVEYPCRCNIGRDHADPPSQQDGDGDGVVCEN